jgi:hypothetical protein
MWEPDSAKRWYTLMNGYDTCCVYNAGVLWMQGLHNIMQGADGRMYVGALFSPEHAWQVIHQPNLKGSACQLVPKGFRPDTFALYTNGKARFIRNVPNMPNYNLGPLPNPTVCWPASVAGEALEVKNNIQLWPNPVSGMLKVKLINASTTMPYTVYTTTGNKILTGTLQPSLSNTLPTNNLPPGVYYLKVGEASSRFVVY